MVARTSPAPLTVAPKALASSPVPALAAAVMQWLALACTQYKGPGAANALRALILADLCPVPLNVIFHGPPGTGKTAMASAWAKATVGLSRFLASTLSPWTDVAEWLGPVDMTALAAGELKRSTSGKRPTVQTALTMLADELPRAAPGIKAASLPILSDRVTPTWEPCTVHTFIAGANTRMTGEDDAALVDRFALKVDVPRLMSAPDLRAVIGRNVPVDGAAPTAAPLPVLPSGTVDTLRAHAATVNVPGPILDALTKLALALRGASPSGTSYPDVSERRWVIATRILQAAATLRGSDTVDWCDLTSVLPMVLDDGEESRAAVKLAINASIPKWASAVAEVEAACAAAVARAFRCGDGQPSTGEADAHVKVNAELRLLADTVKAYPADVIKRVGAIIDAARTDVVDAYARGQAAQTARDEAAR